MATQPVSPNPTTNLNGEDVGVILNGTPYGVAFHGLVTTGLLNPDGTLATFANLTTSLSQTERVTQSTQNIYPLRPEQWSAINDWLTVTDRHPFTPLPNGAGEDLSTDLVLSILNYVTQKGYRENYNENRRNNLLPELPKYESPDHWEMHQRIPRFVGYVLIRFGRWTIEALHSPSNIQGFRAKTHYKIMGLWNKWLEDWKASHEGHNPQTPEEAEEFAQDAEKFAREMDEKYGNETWESQNRLSIRGELPMRDVKQWLNEMDYLIGKFHHRKLGNTYYLDIERNPKTPELITSIEALYEAKMPASLIEFYRHCHRIDLEGIFYIRIYSPEMILDRKDIFTLFPNIPPNDSQKLIPFGGFDLYTLFIRGEDGPLPGQVLYLTEDMIFERETIAEKMLVIESFEVLLERLLLDVKAAIRLDATWDYLWTPFFLIE